MLLELIFNVVLRKVTDGLTHKIPSSRAPVGAKNSVHISLIAFKHYPYQIRIIRIYPLLNLCSLRLSQNKNWILLEHNEVCRDYF